MISIYTISCPETGVVVYVGQTANFNQRVANHLCQFINDPKSNWIKEVKRKGLKPKFEIVTLVESRLDAINVESELIRKYLSEGVDLLNVGYKKTYYKFDFEGNFISEVHGINNVRYNRLSYLGYVYNDEPTFPKWKVDEYKRSKSVRRISVHQYSKCGKFIKTYFGVREAGRITGIDHRSIQQVAGGSKVRKSAGGFIWKYKKIDIR